MRVSVNVYEKTGNGVYEKQKINIAEISDIDQALEDIRSFLWEQFGELEEGD